METQATPADPLVGKTIQGRYRVLRKLGEGGMGVVYTALHVDIEKKVAIKVLRDDFSKRPEVVRRFRQEAKAASRIGHANIVDVTDFGQLEDGGVYFVMEMLQGKPLADVVRGTPMPLLRTVPIINQISRALSAAHKIGIVHRDLKPENIFIVEKDEQHDFVKVLDFGIAKISDQDSEGKRLTKTGMIFGTPEYMSPEQAAGKPLDHRVDVYALGCIMFEMFTGQVPFNGESFMAVLTQHMFEPVPMIEEVFPATDVPRSVREVVYRAMAKEVSARYEDMAHLEADLERALRDEKYVVERSEPQSGLIRVTDGRMLGRETTGSVSVVGTRMESASSSSIGMEIHPGRRKTAGFVVAGLVGLVLCAIGIAYGTGVLDRRVENNEEAQAKVPNPVVAAPGSPSEKVANPQSDTALEKGLVHRDKVQVRIETEPSGAVIEVEGMGQVCSASPCDVTLWSGAPLELSASLDGKSAKMIFTASEQNKSAKLILPGSEVSTSKERQRRQERREKSAKDAAEKGEGNRKQEQEWTGSSDGLKIPEVFKEP
jgi:serine/threonine-protein kinase